MCRKALLCREMGSKVRDIEVMDQLKVNVALQYKKINEIIDLGLNVSLIANSFSKDAAVH